MFKAGRSIETKQVGSDKELQIGPDEGGKYYLEHDVDSLILVHGELPFAFQEVNDPMGKGLNQAQQDISGYQKNNATVNQRVAGHPVAPVRKQALFTAVDFVVAIFTAAHCFRLEHEVRQGVTYQKHEKCF